MLFEFEGETCGRERRHQDPAGCGLRFLLRICRRASSPQLGRASADPDVCGETRRAEDALGTLEAWTNNSHAPISSHAGLATRAELLKAGAHPDSITPAWAAGEIVRVRHGLYAIPGLPTEVLRAAHLGGVLASLSALPLLGLWEPPNHILHVSVRPNSKGLRDPGPPDDAARSAALRPPPAPRWPPARKQRTAARRCGELPAPDASCDRAALRGARGPRFGTPTIRSPCSPPRLASRAAPPPVRASDRYRRFAGGRRVGIRDALGVDATRHPVRAPEEAAGRHSGRFPRGAPNRGRVREPPIPFVSGGLRERPEADRRDHPAGVPRCRVHQQPGALRVGHGRGDDRRHAGAGRLRADAPLAG